MIDPVEFGKQMGALIREATEPLRREIAELKAREPERGEKGEDGAPGKDADPVDADTLADAVVAKLLASDKLETLADLAAGAAVAKHFEANPVQHGKDGEPGPQGDRGEPGEKGIDGKDGIGLAGAMIDRNGELVVTLTNGETKALGVIVGKDGPAGSDGKDGLSVENMVREYVPESHEVVERWTQAGVDKELRYPAGGIHHGGYWMEGVKSQAGQSWTHNGTLWIAKRATASEPSTASDDWAIGARKGRDGRDGKDGKPPPGPVRLNDGA